VRLLRIFAATRSALPRVLPLFRDSRVPFWLKAAAVTAALLIISPLDVFGDIPVLGFFDDAVLLALLINAFVALCARWTMREVVYAKPARIVNPMLLP
jgi:uncharacterized membrane protein YkvA (DUF1232 family)